MRLTYRLLLLSTFAFLLHGQILGEVTLFGRGNGIEVFTWKCKKNSVKSPKLIQKDGEAFCGIIDDKSKTSFIGGAFEDQGTVWIKKKGEDEYRMTHLDESRVIYDLYQRQDGSIVAGGVHRFKGAAVWVFSEKGTWEGPEVLHKSTILTCLGEDSTGRLFAGGIHGPNGKVWIKNGDTWGKGTSLHQSKEINTLVASKEGMIAAGEKVSHRGAYWLFNGSSWNNGADLKFSLNIYVSTKDKNGVIYLGGAGKEDKVLWENSQGFWNALPLDDGLALYSAHSTKKRVYFGGWNKKRRGKVWYKDHGKTTWSKGADIKDCFVVRGIES